MIIKLPICHDNKIIFSNFFIEKIYNPDKYIISLFNRNYENKIIKIKIPCCNNFEGISYLDLFFPLELNIIENKIYFQYFMQKIFLSQSDLPIDFLIYRSSYPVRFNESTSTIGMAKSSMGINIFFEQLGSSSGLWNYETYGC